MIVVLDQIPVVDVQLSSTADSITVTWSAPEKGGDPKPESTEGGRGVSVLKRRKGAPVHLG